MSWVRKHKTVVGLALGLPVSAAFLWLAFRNADPAAVQRSLADARTELIALAVVAMGLVYLLQAARWRTIVPSHSVGLPRFYEMVISGVACSNVLPGRLGDLFRARWLGQEARIPAGRALGTVVLDRGCDVVALLVFLAVGLVAVASVDWLVRIAVGAAIGLLVLGAVLVFARVYTGTRVRERHRRGLVRRVLRDTAEMLAEPLGRRRPSIWLGLSLAAWATWSVAAILVSRSLGIDLSFVDALFVAAAMNLGVAIPSSPGFVGTYQWLGVASLGLLGVPAAEALAFSILLHACWYVPTTLVGGLALGFRALARVRQARIERAAARALE